MFLRILVLLYLNAVLISCYSFHSPSEDALKELSRKTIQTTEKLYPLSYLIKENPGKRRVIFVHGTPGNAKVFARYLLTSPRDFEYISIDRLGFGESWTQSAVPSFQTQAKSLYPLLEMKKNLAPILVGHSLGGPIALRAAALYPKHVGGVIVLAGSVSPELEEPSWYNHLGALPLIRDILPQSIRNSNSEIFAAKEQTQALSGLLGNIQCPVTIIHGTDDSLVPYANVQYLQKKLTTSQIVKVIRIEKQGHFIPWEREKEVQEAITQLAALIKR